MRLVVDALDVEASSCHSARRDGAGAARAGGRARPRPPRSPSTTACASTRRAGATGRARPRARRRPGPSAAGGHWRASVVVRGIAARADAPHRPSAGVWVNAELADRRRRTGSSRARRARLGAGLAAGGRYAWHDHRLSPPPASTARPRRAFAVPVTVGRRPPAITGDVRPRGAARSVAVGRSRPRVLAGGIGAAVRRRSLRGALTIGLGRAAGHGRARRGDDVRRPRRTDRWGRLASDRSRRSVVAVVLGGAARCGFAAGADPCGRRRRRGRGSGEPQLAAGVLARRGDLGAAGKRRAARCAVSRSSAASLRPLLSFLPRVRRARGAGRDEAGAAVRALLAALALLAGPSVQPWPVGPGPRYTPGRAPPEVAAGKALGGLRCGRQARLPRPPRALRRPPRRRRAGGIGVAEPLVHAGVSDRPDGCTYPLRTLRPDGVVEVAAGARAPARRPVPRSGGSRSGRTRLLSFHSSAPVRAYVAGRARSRAGGAIPLTPHAQIVLEIGGYVPPHSFFLFTGGDS